MRMITILLAGAVGAVTALLASQRKRTIKSILTTIDQVPDTKDAPPTTTLDPTEIYDGLPSDGDLDKKIGEDLDPEVGEFRIGAFDVDAHIADDELEEIDTLELFEERTAEQDELEGTGELYGVVVPPAVDHDLAADEDRDAYKNADQGEHFYEALVASATEFGAEPEHELNVIDQSDSHTRPRNEHPDEPVADKGSGGRGGL